MHLMSLPLSQSSVNLVEDTCTASLSPLSPENTYTILLMFIFSYEDDRNIAHVFTTIELNDKYLT